MTEEQQGAEQHGAAQQSPANPTVNPAIHPGVGRPPLSIPAEFDSPKNMLPPIVPVLAAVAGLAILAIGFLYLIRPKLDLTGTVIKAAINPVHVKEEYSEASGVPVKISATDSMVVLLQVLLRNTGDKPLKIHTMEAILTPEKGDPITDAPAVQNDLGRLFQAFPALKPSRIDPLTVDQSIAPGKSATGMILVRFAISVDDLQKRRDFSVKFVMEDQAVPLIVKVPATAVEIVPATS